MNLYIVVEGEQTETKVYPAWLQILVPQLHRIDDAWNLSENSDSYYLFSAGGIPSIYKHVSNAVADINEINACGKGKYDYLLMCIDVYYCRIIYYCSCSQRNNHTNINCSKI